MNEKKELTVADLALYLGCEVLFENEVYVLEGVNERVARPYQICIGPWVKIKDVKPILRPLSDMSDKELLEFAELCTYANGFEIEKAVAVNYKRVKCLFGDGWNQQVEYLIVNESGETWYTSYFNNEEAGGRNVVNQHEQTIWLIRHQFDIFGWIKSGLAIDKTKI